MKDNYLPFALPDIGDEEISAVVDCMKSGWMTTGPNAVKFEKDFEEFMGGDVHAISTNSATAGLILSLEALGIGPGDEVIVPTYTFSASGMSVMQLGAKAVLVDIDPVTMNLDPSKIEAAITSNTKAIMPVHFAGLACDMDAIYEIAKKHNLKIIEDAAHALPTTYNGKLIGNKSSDASVYSFYATKTITTGEGGMVVTPYEEVAKRTRTMRLHGISKDVFDRYTAKGAKWHYEIVAPGFKCNMTDIAASIGIEQLKKLKSFQKKREEIAELYLNAFADLPLILPAKANEGDMHSWHLFVIRLRDDAGISRDDFIEKMDSQGIGCSVHFIPLHKHSYWKESLGVSESDFPEAEKAFNMAVSLPVYTKMTEADVNRVIEAVKSILC